MTATTRQLGADASEAGLPSHWRVSKIGDLFESWGGHTPSKSNGSYWGVGVPWVSSKEVKSLRLRTSTYTVTQKAINETGLRVCPPGSVLVVVRSGILAHTLPVTVSEVPVTINQDIKAFFSQEPLLNEWLALFLRMSAHELLASSRRDGTTVQSVQYPLLKDTAIPVPPLNERRLILKTVNIALAKQASVPQRLVAARRAVERFRQAVLAAACSGRLTEDLNGNSVQENGLPLGWCQARLSELCSRVSVGHVGPTTQHYISARDGIVFIRSQNVRPGRLVLEDTRYITKDFHEALNKSQLRPGDVLIVRVGANRGDCCMVPLDHRTELNCANIVFARPTLVESQYLALYLQGPGRSLLLQETTGSAQGVINTKAVAAIEIALPPTDEQGEIVKRASAMLAAAEGLLTRINVASQKVNRSSQSVLAKAFRGELIPPNGNEGTVSNGVPDG